MTFTLPQSIAEHFTCCPICRAQNRAIGLHTNGQVACLDTVACAKDAAALAEWCDSQAELAAVESLMARGLSVC